MTTPTYEQQRSLLDAAIESIEGRYAPRGFKFERHFDFYVDEITDEESAWQQARKCLADWHEAV